MDLSSTELFDLVVRGVIVIALGCLGIIFNTMIIIVLRKPEFTKVSINLIMLCKSTKAEILQLNHTQFICRIKFSNEKVANRKLSPPSIHLLKLIFTDIIKVCLFFRFPTFLLIKFIRQID